MLSPLELIDRIAALVPPPRTRRHRYFGVLAPNSPLRAAVTALATSAQPATVQAEPATTGEDTPGGCQWTILSQSSPSPPSSATQALTGALPVGSVDRQNLRGVPAAAPDMRWADAPDCVHHAKRRYQANTRPHRCGLTATAHIPGTRATAVKEMCCADGWLGANRARLGN